MLPYLSTTSFLRFPSRKFGEKVVTKTKSPNFSIIGIPHDISVTNRPGSRFGPEAIRKASLMLCDGIHPGFNIDPLKYSSSSCDDDQGQGQEVVDYGDIVLPNTSLSEVRKKLESSLRENLFSSSSSSSNNNNSTTTHPIFLGGDHSITLSIIRVLSQHFSENNNNNKNSKLACIHFDAHCDTWKDHFGEPEGHGTWTRQAIDEGLIDPECTFQIGIRSSADEDARLFVERKGGMIFSGKQLRGIETLSALNENVISKIKKRLQERGNPNVYLTFDIDVLDPSVCPGTGTPEVGGLSSNQALTLMEEFSGDKEINFVGMDLVEVSPAYDVSELTSNMAANLVWTYLCGRMKVSRK